MKTKGNKSTIGLFPRSQQNYSENCEWMRTDPAHTTDKTNLNHFERVLAPLFYDSATMHIFFLNKQHENSIRLIKYFCSIPTNESDEVWETLTNSKLKCSKLDEQKEQQKKK